MTSLRFRIRVAGPDDRAAVSALLLKSYTALLRPDYDPEILEKALPLITKANPDLLTSGTYYVACCGDGTVLGAGGWTKSSPTGQGESPGNGNIRHFVTDPDQARQGIGRALMARCLQDARAAGLTDLNCYSTLNGEAFYAACGFRTVEPFDVTLPGGVVFPSVRMERDL
jgi:GNAT superfamily N-acetyltransferase